MGINLVLFYVANFIGFIPVLLLIRSKFIVHQFKGIVLYSSLVGFASLYELLFTHVLQVNAEIWFKVYSVLDFFIILYIFRNQDNKPGNYFFVFFILIYLFVFIFLTFFGSEIHFLRQDSYLNFIMILFIVSYYMIWFSKYLKTLLVKSLLDIPFFYFLSGLLLYYSGIISLSLLSEPIIKSELSIVDYWVVHIIFLILFRILLIISIWKGRTT